MLHGLTAVFFLCLGSLPQLAVCTDAAGHHALELRDAACCHPAETAGDARSFRSQRVGCAPDCSDVPLGVVAAAQRPDHFQGTVTATSCVRPISGVVPLAGGRDLRAAAWPIPPLDFTLRALRSTIALC